jgi:lipoprotein-releasing system permease protein
MNRAWLIWGALYLLGGGSGVLVLRGTESSAALVAVGALLALLAVAPLAVRFGGQAGFQWYIAWRYLMARPRRLSGAVLGFIAAMIWVAVACTLAAGWIPLVEPLFSTRAPVPLWLALAAALGATAAPILFLAATVHFAFFSRPRQMSGWLIWTAVWAGLVALASLGLTAWVREVDLVFPTWRLVVFGVAVLQVPFGLRWIASHEPASRGRSRSKRASILGWSAVELFVAGCVVFLAGYALVSVLPSLPTREQGWPLWLAIPAAWALALLVPSLVRGGRRRWMRAAALVVAGILGTLALYGWWGLSLEGAADFRLLGDYGVRMPMELFITSGVAIALLAVGVIILAIRYFFTFFTTVSIMGVLLGSSALVIVLSVMGGFESDLREKILGSNAHMLVTRADEEDSFREYRDVMAEVVDVPGAVAATPYLLSEVVIAANSNYANVIIKGIDPRTVGDATELARNVDEEQALDKLWPLAEDGKVLGAPPPLEREPDAGPGAAEPAGPSGSVVDPAPDDFVVPDLADPIDLSGGDPDADPGSTVDPAPDDFAVGDDLEPLDLSQGDDAEAPERQGPDLYLDLEPEGGEIRFRDGDPIVREFDAAGELRRRIPAGVARLPGVLVGRELVKQIHLYEGQEVKIISPLGQATPAGPVPRTKPLRVAGTFFTGMYEYDLKYIYVELGSLQDFLDLGDEVLGIEIRVQDPERTDRVKRAIEERLGAAYRVQDWKELNRSLFAALKLEKIAMFLVLAIVILVASFSIVGNLIMVVVEKTKEISILKTLGASDTGVMRIFIIQGFFIGLVGTVTGVVLGLLSCWALDHYGFPLDPDVYYIDKLPIHVEPFAVAAVFAAGILISVIATLYPAYLAARTEVVDGLRYE